MSDPTAPAPERTACCGDHCTATATHGPGAFPVACWQHAGDWPEIPAPPPSEAPAPSEPARPVPLSTADLDGLERSLDAGRTWEPDEATARWVLGVLRRASEPAAPGGEAGDALAEAQRLLRLQVEMEQGDGWGGTDWWTSVFEAIDRARAAVSRLAADNARLKEERAAALSVTTREGLLASEWVLRTGMAERKRDRLAARVAELEAAARGKGAT